MKCMMPRCEKESKFRGLCKACYNSACILVNAGMFTWDDIISKGFCLERKEIKGRPRIISDSDVDKIIFEKFGYDKVPSRDAFIDAIGGSTAVLSKKYIAKLYSVFPLHDAPSRP
jgi:hypothetical protein